MKNYNFLELFESIGPQMLPLPSERGVYNGGVLCHRSIIQGNPMQLHEILRYARTLPFQAEPDYDSLQVILRQLIDEHQKLHVIEVLQKQTSTNSFN